MPDTPATAIALLGYCDSRSCRPGDTVNFKVSSSLDAPFSARLVRVICADPNPDGPGIIEGKVESAIDGEYPSRHQPFYPGSYLSTSSKLPREADCALTLRATIWPTLPDKRGQTIISCGELTLAISDSGRLQARVGNQVLMCEQKLMARHWYTVQMSWNPHTALLRLTGQNLQSAQTQQMSAEMQCDKTDAVCDKPVSIAASLVNGIPEQHFNGKIEAPSITLADDPNTVLAAWDFSIDTESLVVHDTGPSKLNATVHNLPARAMTGSNWDGSEMCWRQKPEHYCAIHFHDDDIVDFNWQTDFSFTVPDDLPSGIYAAKIRCGEHEDSMPFFVCPPRNKRTADLCVLISTFTYTVYGNHARPDFVPQWKQRISDWNAYPHNPAEHTEYGLSTYNFHSDGSGICHASHRRPLFNLKPGYLTFGYGTSSGLRHLQADTHLISWLHHKGIDYDIITDDELHEQGADCLKGYRALCTGSHPEYHTTQTLDALQHYRDNGGHFMYLGGNGFYWRVALHKEQSGAIEIRRAEGGIRAWAAEPGEYFQAFDGLYGGLWRRNGRPPQQLAGIGFSAQGQFEGTYYRRTTASHNPEVKWIFEGVEEDIIGDFGLSGGGAAGFELDRADTRLGSPENIVVLASSETTTDSFVLVPEEQLTHITNWPGKPVAELLRADMVYFDVAGGGSVFATGSITFCGSLPHNNFDNNVSRILHNVMSRFLSSPPAHS